MSYRAFYRQWRPRFFNEIVGQDHVSRTLKNAVKSKRVAHAYLFCGPRGTGKTSTAKIFAKALNCPACEDGEPCNNCAECIAINNGSSVDVIEIDAASNRGIEEIRALREKVKYAPTSGRYKVYIVDEVHMLTNEAFNALLKTLEEPPSHVIFVLATTEPHKLPLTILSRCQRFDFHMIQAPDIIKRLKEVAEAACLNVEANALSIIARAADGSLRDALSILDQCAAFSGPEIKLEDVHDVLGTVHEEIMEKLARCLIEKDTPTALHIVADLVEHGKDLRLFAGEFAGYLRLILLVKLSPGDKDLLTPGNNMECLQELAGLFAVGDLLRNIDILCQAEQEMKWSSRQRLVLELALIKILHSERQVPSENVPALEARLTALEEALNELKQFKNTRGDLVKPDKANKPPGKPAEAGPDSDAAFLKAVNELERLRGAWPSVIERVRKMSPTAGAALKESLPVQVEVGAVKIGFDNSFLIEVAERKANKEVIEKIIGTLLRRQVKIICEKSGASAAGSQDAGSRAAGAQSQSASQNAVPKSSIQNQKPGIQTANNKKTSVQTAGSWVIDKKIKAVQVDKNSEIQSSLVNQAIKFFNGEEIKGNNLKKGDVFFNDEGEYGENDEAGSKDAGTDGKNSGGIG